MNRENNLKFVNINIVRHVEVILVEIGNLCRGYLIWCWCFGSVCPSDGMFPGVCWLVWFVPHLRWCSTPFSLNGSGRDPWLVTRPAMDPAAKLFAANTSKKKKGGYLIYQESSTCILCFHGSSQSVAEPHMPPERVLAMWCPISWGRFDNVTHHVLDAKHSIATGSLMDKSGNCFFSTRKLRPVCEEKKLWCQELL